MMPSGLSYLKKLEIDDLLDNIFYTSLILFKKYDGKICSICKIKQGFLYKGWEKYYCKHTELKVNELLKKHKNKAMNLLISLSNEETKK